MSLNVRILIFSFLIGPWCFVAQQSYDSIKKTYKDKKPNELVRELDSKLEFFKYSNAELHLLLLKDIEVIPSNQLDKNTQRIKTCALAEGYLHIGNTKQSIKLITDLITPNLRSLNEREEALYLWLITREKSKKVEALSLASNRVKKSKYSRDINKIYRSYKDLSFVYLIHSNADSAIFYASLATAEAKRLSDKTKLMEAMRYQGKVYHYFEYYVEAVKKKLQMIQFAIEFNNNYFRAYGYFEIALISLELQNYNQVSQYLERARTYFKKINDQRGELTANIFEIQNNYSQGKTVDFPVLLSLSQRLNKFEDQLSKSLASMVMAVYLSKEKEFKKSIKELEEAENLLVGMEEEKLKYLIHKILAINYLEIKDLKSAKIHLDKAFPPFKTVNLMLGETYLFLAELQLKRNNLTEALKYQNEYIEVTRSNYKQQFARAVEQLTEGDLREEREKLISEQQANLLEGQKEKERISFLKDRQLIIGISLIVVIIMVLLILFIRLRAVRSKQLQREAEMSQTLLRSQMNPHFVFNAMSVIQSYIYANDPDKSSKFLVNFSRLMRLILENSPKEMISLELEYEILDKYLNTQKMRFEDRFDYELNFDEELLFAKAMIPPMIAQPFVENAIEHGQLHSIEGGKISVTITKRDELLEVLIEDNGVGRKKSAKTNKIKEHKSMAIDITKERIDILNRKYKVNGLADITDLFSNGRGTRVRILLPLKFEVI